MSWLKDIVSRLPIGEKRGAEGVPDQQGIRLIASIPLPLLVCDEAFSVLAANPAATLLFRISERRLLQSKLLQILGDGVYWFRKGTSRQRIVTPETLLRGGNPKLLVGKFPRLGERSFHLYARSLPVRGRKDCLFLFQDVTATRNLEAMISTSRNELLAIFDGIEDPMVMIDRDFRIRRINKSMLDAVGGNDYAEFIGKACYYKLHGHLNVCAQCTAGRTFRSGKRTERLGLLEQRPKPDEMTYQITCYPLKGPDGRTMAIAESYRNVTALVDMQEKLYESERNRVIEPLAAGIAHEIRNPLTIIRSTAQYCLGEVPANHDDLSLSLRSIIKSVDVADSVIEDLLDFSRPQTICFEIQALTPLLKEGLRLIRSRALSQHVRIRRVIPKQLPKIRLDRKRFLQAYMNFLINALDAMPAGGELVVAAHWQAKQGTVHLSICDTGAGFPEELVEKPLRPFYTTKKGGVGLGLSIGDAIIRSHEGRIHFKGLKGKGGEIAIELPLPKPHSRKAAK